MKKNSISRVESTSKLRNSEIICNAPKKNTNTTTKKSKRSDSLITKPLGLSAERLAIFRKESVKLTSDDFDYADPSHHCPPPPLFGFDLKNDDTPLSHRRSLSPRVDLEVVAKMMNTSIRRDKDRRNFWQFKRDSSKKLVRKRSKKGEERVKLINNNNNNNKDTKRVSEKKMEPSRRRLSWRKASDEIETNRKSNSLRPPPKPKTPALVRNNTDGDQKDDELMMNIDLSFIPIRKSSGFINPPTRLANLALDNRKSQQALKAPKAADNQPVPNVTSGKLGLVKSSRLSVDLSSVTAPRTSRYKQSPRNQKEVSKRNFGEDTKKSKSLTNVKVEMKYLEEVKFLSVEDFYQRVCKLCKEQALPIPTCLLAFISQLFEEKIQSLEHFRFLPLARQYDLLSKYQFSNSFRKFLVEKKSSEVLTSRTNNIAPKEEVPDQSENSYSDDSDESDEDKENRFSNRISSLAKLAAGLSLAGLEIAGEDESHSDEILDITEKDLTLPESENWNIQPGTVVEITSRIGKGATSSVYSGIINRKVVAVKRVELKSFSEGLNYAQTAVQREYDIVRSINHENIIKYYGLFFNKDTQQVNIVMELIDGVPITDLVLFCNKINEDLSSYILKFVMEGLLSLHESMIIHRDIKPDNALIDISATVKLIDFGTSIRCTPTTLVRKRSAVGTPWYCAPEVINTQAYSLQCDIWSLGCFTIELVSGKPPFDELNDIACLYKMAEGKPPPIPEGLSNTCTDFIKKCLEPDWQKRPSILELLTHPFVSQDSSKRELQRHKLINIISDMKEIKTRKFQVRRKEKPTNQTGIKL